MDYDLPKKFYWWDYVIIFIFILFFINNINKIHISYLFSENNIFRISIIIAILTLSTWFYDKHATFLANKKFREKVFMYDLFCNLDYVNEHIGFINYNLIKGKLSVLPYFLDDRLMNSIINSQKIVELPNSVIQSIFAVGNKMAEINRTLESFAPPQNRELTNELLATISDSLHKLRGHLRNIFIDLGKEKEYIERIKSSEEQWKKIRETPLPL